MTSGTRAEAARYLRSRDQADVVGDRAVSDILNFFEIVSLLSRQKALDKKAVWHTFGSWILQYHHLCADYLASEQASDPTIYRDFCELYDAVLEIERRERNLTSTSIVNEETAAYFLDYESCVHDLPRETKPAK